MTTKDEICNVLIKQLKFYVSMYEESVSRRDDEGCDFWYKRLYPLQEIIRIATGKDGIARLDDENELYFLCDDERYYLE